MSNNTNLLSNDIIPIFYPKGIPLPSSILFSIQTIVTQNQGNWDFSFIRWSNTEAKLIKEQSNLIITLIFHQNVHQHPKSYEVCWASLNSGAWFNIKIPSYQYRKSHCGDKTVVRSSYLHNGISYTGKMTDIFLLNKGPDVSNTCHCQLMLCSNESRSVLSQEILVANDFDKVARTAIYYLQYY